MSSHLYVLLGVAGLFLTAGVGAEGKVNDSYILRIKTLSDTSTHYCAIQIFHISLIRSIIIELYVTPTDKLNTHTAWCLISIKISSLASRSTLHKTTELHLLSPSLRKLSKKSFSDSAELCPPRYRLVDEFSCFRYSGRTNLVSFQISQKLVLHTPWSVVKR